MQKNNDSLNLETPKDLARLIKNNLCVVIKFSASWCGPCQNPNFKKAYVQLVKSYEKIDEIVFVELDCDANDDLVSDTRYYNFAIKSIPHFKICYEGNIVSEINGQQLDNIKEILDAVVKKHQLGNQNQKQ